MKKLSIPTAPEFKQTHSGARPATSCSRCVWCRNKTSGGFFWERHPEAVVCSLSCVNLAEKAALTNIATLPKPCPNCGAVTEGYPPWGSWKDGSGGCKRCNRRKEISSANAKGQARRADAEVDQTASSASRSAPC